MNIIQIVVSVAEWGIWVFMVSVSITLLFIFRKMDYDDDEKDEEENVIARRNSRILGAGMLFGCITVLFLPINKFHLLGWWVIVSFFPQLVSRFYEAKAKRTAIIEAEAARSARFQQGRKAYKAGEEHCLAHRWQEALDHYDAASEYGFINDRMLGDRATCLQALGWHLDAIDDFTWAIKKEPEDCNLFFLRSISQHSVGNQAGHDSDLDEAIRLAKESNPLTKSYNATAKAQGWGSALVLYELHGLATRDTPDFCIAKAIEETKQRGRRKTGQRRLENPDPKC